MFTPESVVTGQAFRVTLGLRRLDPATWLDLGPDRVPQLTEKRRLLAERHSDVVRFLPGSEPASAELLDAVVAHLARHGPDLDRSPDRSVHPIDAAGRLTCEDLCLLQRVDGCWRLTAATVCFPSRWRLADKIGRSVDDIHEPVPGYDTITAAVDAFFDRLTVDRPMWRTNWSLLGRPDLFQDGTRSELAPGDPGQLTFRVERQTLRRLRETGAVIFTIRTHTQPLADLVAGQPGRAADLAATLRTVPPATLEYKSWSRSLDRLLSWLARQP